MREITFELCAETPAACIAARDGGAHRIELCSRLEVGGLTPEAGLIQKAVATGLPVHAMVRPRAGDFMYSAAEVNGMREEVQRMKRRGIAGVVFGVLRADATVDIERMSALVELARPLQVTFHRAFDATPSLAQALADVIATGCDRILTSGGEPDVVTGGATIAALVAQAEGHIAIAAGGGLRLKNAADVARLTRTTHFHGSLRGDAGAEPYIVKVDDVRSIIQQLRSAV